MRCLILAGIPPDADFQYSAGLLPDYVEIICDRNFLVTLTTSEEKFVFENISTDIILCEIAAKARAIDLVISPIELLVLGREIGRQQLNK